MCTTSVSFLPRIDAGMVQLICNKQKVGTSTWSISSADHFGMVRGHAEGWERADKSFYGYVGLNYSKWVPLQEGTTMQFFTTTSSSPAVDRMTWREGCWQAWVTTAHCGKNHWSKLVIGPAKSTMAACDNGISCPDA